LKHLPELLDYSFYFQHIPKVGGSSIFHQLPSEYNSKYYRTKHFDAALKPLYKDRQYTRIIKDHIGLDDAVKIGLLSREELDSKEIIVLWRDPVDRFVSTCNHFGLDPQAMMDRIKYPEKDGEYYRVLGRYAFYSTASDLVKVDGKRVKTTDIRLDQYDKVIEVFAKHDIKIKNLGPSKEPKKYSVNDLTDYHRKFIRINYAEDVEFFNSLK